MRPAAVRRRDAEIEDAHAAGGVDQDVSRLEVAVNDAALVGKLDDVADQRDEFEPAALVEAARCAYSVSGAPSTYSTDTDLDGLPDVYARAINFDPTRRDTDGDGKRDGFEFDLDDADHCYDRSAIERAVA